MQDVIADITRRMGEGMAEFITKEVSTSAVTQGCTVLHSTAHMSQGSTV
jgi:hypothetical protein